FSSLGLQEDEEEAWQNCHSLKALIADPAVASLPAHMPAKPLREYEPHELQDSPESTEAVLGQLIRWEGLIGKTKKTASELLARPPPKFILDVTVAIKAATGFPPDLEDNWPEAREERLARFAYVSEAVSGALGVSIDFDAVDVLKGKEVQKTLLLLQLLALAAVRAPRPEGHQSSDFERAPGVARAIELPAMLDAMDRCIQAAKEQADAKRSAAEAAVSDGSRSLEEKIAVLERQLAEESRARHASEEELLKVERLLQETAASVKNVTQNGELAE
ncbi:unnamed protein product, partial [Polarella glacialis]